MVTDDSERKKRVNITLGEKHLEAIEEEALNLSKFVRKRIEQKYPEYFKD
ncbi:MAG: hypothetical protein ABEJ56_04470 [Candidatus Nanohaloarchaea archaeon]